MTTYTTYGVHNPTTTLTLQHESRSVTITAREHCELRELFELFQAALIGIGYTPGTYEDVICELAGEMERESVRESLAAQLDRVNAMYPTDESDDEDDCA